MIEGSDERNGNGTERERDLGLNGLNSGPLFAYD